MSDFPPEHSRWAMFWFRLRTRRDGLCHAYAEYVGLDCTRPARHDGDHGKRSPR